MIKASLSNFIALGTSILYQMNHWKHPYTDVIKLKCTIQGAKKNGAKFDLADQMLIEVNYVFVSKYAIS